jgi:ZIP family zinc transporter
VAVLSFGETVLLGALAGFTIFLGLPFARLRVLDDRARVALSMFAVGVLAFLFVDVFEHGFGIVEHAVEAFKEGDQGPGEAIGLTALLGAGFAAGTVGLQMIQRVRPKGPTRPPVAGGSTDALDAGTAARLAGATDDARRRALRTGMVIAIAIGLHNFAEGLAIGVSARAGEIGLATILIIGFALHNTTEGFGIVGPLGDVRPSWRWLGLVGVVGGAPTFLGSVVGYHVTSEPLELVFYALAGGAILFVIGEVWNGMRRFGHRELGLWMLTVGFMLGIATDLVVVYGGG